MPKKIIKNLHFFSVEVLVAFEVDVIFFHSAWDDFMFDTRFRCSPGSRNPGPVFWVGPRVP